MNKRIFLTITSFAICFVLFGNVSAQVRGNYSRRDVNTTIRSLETSSDVFSRDFKRFSGQSRYSNGRDDRFVQVVDRFENAVDSLRRNFDRSNDWWSSRNDVQSIMGEAQNVNQMMNELRFARDLEVQWRNMRRDINALARTFSLPTLEGTGGNANPGVGYSNGGGYSGSGYPNGGYSGSGNGGGNWATVRPPSWAVGTFYGQSPQDGQQISLTIDDRGSITAQTGGSMSYGNYTRNNMIAIGGYTSRITRTPSGIRTVSTTDGQTIDYSRNGFGGNSGYYPGGEAGGGNVPNWAVGSYVGRDPASGRAIYLTITGNGNVTVNVDGGNSYGTLNGSVMNVNGATSTVSTTRNGIQTRSNSDGQVINYRRQ